MQPNNANEDHVFTLCVISSPNALCAELLLQYIFVRRQIIFLDYLGNIFTVFENHRKKISFNIASEASYVYILSGQKLIKMPKMANLASFWKPEACGQTVLPDRSVLIGQKLVENAKMQKFKCDIS